MTDEVAVDVKTIARMLSVSPATIYVHAKHGDIPGFRVGGQWRFFPSEVLAHLQRPLDPWAQPPRSFRRRGRAY